MLDTKILEFYIASLDSNFFRVKLVEFILVACGIILDVIEIDLPP